MKSVPVRMLDTKPARHTFITGCPRKASPFGTGIQGAGLWLGFQRLLVVRLSRTVTHSETLSPFLVARCTSSCSNASWSSSGRETHRRRPSPDFPPFPRQSHSAGHGQRAGAERDHPECDSVKLHARRPILKQMQRDRHRAENITRNRPARNRPSSDRCSRTAGSRHRLQNLTVSRTNRHAPRTKAASPELLRSTTRPHRRIQSTTSSAAAPGSPAA